jgi:hypothetical protein
MDVPLYCPNRVGSFWATLFGSSGCTVGSWILQCVFGYSRVTGSLCFYGSSDVPKYVIDDPVGTMCSRVLLVVSLYNSTDTLIRS